MLSSDLQSGFNLFPMIVLRYAERDLTQRKPDLWQTIPWPTLVCKKRRIFEDCYNVSQRKQEIVVNAQWVLAG